MTVAGGSRSTGAAAGDIGRAVRAWLAGLDDGQLARATFPFETEERLVWAYTPGTRQGLAIGDMRPDQRTRAMAVVAASMSERGAIEVGAIMALERVLGSLERDAGDPGWQRRDPDRYWFAVFGDPAAGSAWSWRVGGHHVAVHLTVADGQVVGSAPSFLGANPATVPHGPTAGSRALTGEEALARRVLAGLTGSQRTRAIVDDTAPADILSGNGPRARLAGVPTGVRFDALTDHGRADVEGLIRHYLGRMRPEVAGAEWRRIASDGLDAVTFAWAGSDQVGEGHYYAIRGPRFLIEYDNTQNGANHIHAVCRDLDNDWGTDLLAAHLSAHHRA